MALEKIIIGMVILIIGLFIIPWNLITGIITSFAGLLFIIFHKSDEKIEKRKDLKIKKIK